MSTICRLQRSSWAGTAGGGTRRAAAAAAPSPAPTTAAWAPRVAYAHARSAEQQRRRGACAALRATPVSGTAAAVADAPPAASSPEEQDRLVEGLMAFLREDLQHLFDDQGIDAGKYDPDVVFEDPITYYNGIQGYLFNIAFLRRVFTPTFTLHDVRRSGPLEVTTRWAMSMSLSFARGTPLGRVWDPTLTFTGTSIMAINPQTGRFCRHVDTWDAIQQQRYFSLEAFAHMLQQVGDLRKGPQGAAAGQYEVLLKRKQYEVRKYTRLPQGAPAYGGDGSEAGAGGGSGGVYAVADFSGAASQAAAAAVEQALRRALLADGLRPAGRCWQLVAGGGDEGGPNPARWRNEVLVPLEAFQLWA